MQENIEHIQEDDLASSPPISMSSDDVTNKPTEESFDMKNPEVKPNMEQDKTIEITPTRTSADKLSSENDIKSISGEQMTSQDTREVHDDNFKVGHISLQL